MPTLLLLTASNIFMTIAWYWHLRGGAVEKPILAVILISWGIALIEYCFAVPANRIGHARAAQSCFTAQRVTLLGDATASSLPSGLIATVCTSLPTFSTPRGLPAFTSHSRAVSS